MSAFDVKEFKDTSPLVKDLKCRTAHITCNDIRTISKLLDIRIEYLINWTYEENEKRVFKTDNLCIRYDEKTVSATIKTEESIAKTLVLSKKKMKLPSLITEIQQAPRYYYTDNEIIISYKDVNLPFYYFECAKKLVPFGTPLPDDIVLPKLKTVETTVLTNDSGLLLREKIYYMLPAERETFLSFEFINSSLAVLTNKGKRYKFPMSCRDTWCILSNDFNYRDIVIYADERTYPASIIVNMGTFLRIVREIELLFKPFIISK